VVPHHARGARQARHRLTAALTGSIPPALLADVISVAAELIANAVRHAEPLPGGVVRLAWRLKTSDEIRIIEVRVTDGGAAQLPRPRAASIDEADGRGLKIVEALADRWGVDKDGLGQSVWAELS
jgi:anti-sigma regulatory factor (Ser/Thr protein kinase)